jgi:predicted PurR-regulated permease PerM
MSSKTWKEYVKPIGCLSIVDARGLIVKDNSKIDIQQTCQNNSSNNDSNNSNSNANNANNANNSNNNANNINNTNNTNIQTTTWYSKLSKNQKIGVWSGVAITIIIIIAISIYALSDDDESNSTNN